ncbi:EAL domain-containing protein [Qipengyuania sp. DGS5-3]|uniref:EAL domain-containing protein n=1 Tax=Qipengyuania sp. DGS5-3 TaxID=3349632 RepID=UPI0036D2E301
MLGLTSPALAAPIAPLAEQTPKNFEAAVDAAKSAMMSQPAAALDEANRARALAEEFEGDERAMKIATARWLEGEALVRLNHPEQAEPVLREALEAAERIDPESKLHADLLKSGSSIAGLNGDVATAMRMLQEAHAIYLKLEDGRSRSIVLQNIGSIYASANDHQQALRYYRLAQDAFSQDPMLTLAANNNRGTSYKEMGNHAEAESAYRSALQAAMAMESPLLEARILTNIASAQYMQGRLDEANESLRLGFERAEGPAADWRPFLWGVSAQVAQAQGAPERARSLFEKTFAGQDLANTTVLFRDFHETAHSVYADLGEHETALAHLAAQKRLDDEASEAAASTNFALMNAKFDATNRELRIAQSEQDLTSFKQMAAAGAIALTFVILAILFALFSAKQSRRKVDAANALLTHAARYDALTGLVNRSYSRELLREAMDEYTKSKSPYGLLLIDLDRFKHVNDTHGHAGGDELLERVAERLNKIAGSDGVAARLGGDEFAIVIKNGASIEQLQAMGVEITRALSEPFEVIGSSVLIGGSVGFAIGPEDGTSVDELVRHADLALYQAKDQGRGRAIGFEGWMADAAGETGQLEQDLRKAIAEGDLTLAFQPIVSAETGKIASREALLRWHHHTRGAVDPSLLVQVAENAGLIEPIGDWVMREACRVAATWPAHEKVAINVSVAQLTRKNFTQSVVSALAWSKLEPSRLEIELTESIFLREDLDSKAILRGLRDLGVSLSLDDFGTGYSSLSYLQRDLFSKLKIDRSFVSRAVEGDENSIAIVKAMLGLADTFNMETVAEGVETDQHATMMTELGCTYLQGYHFGHPVEVSLKDALHEMGQIDRLEANAA